MSPKKVHGLPPNLTLDVKSGRYRYRSPETGNRTTISHDRDDAIEKANRLNAALEIRKQHRIHKKIDPDFGSVIDSYIVESVPMQPWGDDHARNILAGLGAIKNDLGRVPFSKIDRLVIARWITARNVAGHQKRRYRLIFVRLYEYAIGKKWVNFNEGDAVPKYSRSKKLAENRPKRKRMNIEQFWAIHDNAPAYIQVAMQMSLVTLQSRQEILNMQYSDIRDGSLFVIRKKTATESSSAFIRIQVNSEIERIVSLSRASKIVSPYIVHRLPKSRQKGRKHDIPHPTYILPQQFTYNFGYARTRAGITQQYAQGEAPTFHEIRSLGSRIMKADGVPKSEISRLMAHADVKTSEIYLDGRDAISDDDYTPVRTTITLKR